MAIASVVAAVLVRSPVHAVPEVMSLLSWLKKSQTTKPVVFERPKVAGLPDPNAEGNAVDGTLCESANKEIEAQIAPSKGKKRKRSSYNHYDAETRVTMAKCACEIGLMAAARKFSKELGRPVAYTTTIQSIRNEYQKKTERRRSRSTRSNWPPSS